MSKWLTALSKMGLVELEDGDIAHQKQAISSSEIDRVLAESQELLEQAGGQRTKSEPEPEPEPASEPSPEIENTPSTELKTELIGKRSFSEIYTAGNIQESPYPVERMIKLLEGLKAMPAEMRISAIRAMDTADDTWTIEDSILDAQRKSDLLKKEQQKLRKVVGKAQKDAKEKIGEQDTYLGEATALIRQQIEELEGKLAKEIQDVAEKKSQIEVELQNTRSACEQEYSRLGEEIKRIDTVIQQIGEEPK